MGELSKCLLRRPGGAVAAQGLRVNGARIVERDLPAPNGVIHVIDTLLMPAG